jgi:hypothetical protein
VRWRVSRSRCCVRSLGAVALPAFRGNERTTFAGSRVRGRRGLRCARLRGVGLSRSRGIGVDLVRTRLLVVVPSRAEAASGVGDAIL